MKILLLIDSLGAGGAERAFLGLAGYLATQGYKTEIQLYKKVKRLYSIPENIKVKWNPLLRFTRPALWILSLFWKLFPKQKPDLIISFMWMMNYTAAYFCAENPYPGHYFRTQQPAQITRTSGFVSMITFLHPGCIHDGCLIRRS